MLKGLQLNGQPAIEYFDDLQFGTFSKKNHIRAAVKKLNEQLVSEGHEPIAFSQIMLFDDEARNRDVEEIGIQFVRIWSEEQGLTADIFNKAVGCQLIS